MDKNLLAAITAAVEAYIESDTRAREVRFGQRLSPWKMAARREIMSRRRLAVRGNPLRVRLGKYSLL
jgi:seryl-tRNA(Sec) selenium transferase